MRGRGVGKKRRGMGHGLVPVADGACCCEDDGAPAPCPKDGPTLRHAPKGCRCRVKKHHACGAVRQRLLDLGFLPNAEVEVVRVATLGDPIEVRVGNYFVALRKEEAERIDVELV